jgi:hypothetical protein
MGVDVYIVMPLEQKSSILASDEQYTVTKPFILQKKIPLYSKHI